MRPRFIPSGAILTPNQKEFRMLFGEKVIGAGVGGEIGELMKAARDTFLGRAYPFASLKVADSPQKGHFAASLVGFPYREEIVRKVAKKYDCVVVLKGSETLVCSPDECWLVKGGNAGLTKGGTGDVQAGLTVALAAKNPPLLAALSASFIVKKAADELYKRVGFAFNADDLAEEVPKVLGKYFR